MNKQTLEKLTTEEQIEWDLAPSDATHYCTYMFYKYSEGSWRYWNGCSWVVSENPAEWFTNLIAKPIKLYMPKVGEECEFSSVGHHSGFMWCIFRGIMSDGSFIVEYHRNTSQDRVTCDAFNSLTTVFRPIITERDTRAVELYRMFHNDGLQDREIMQSDKFDTYLSMFDILVRIQRGDV